MKRLFALFTLLAFCLTLPATAFAAGTAGARSAARALTAAPRAAAPEWQVIYVGDQNVTSGGYWTTDSEGKVTSAGATQPSNNYIHYDAGNNTLTLHNATIKTYNSDTNVGGAAIGVANTSGNAELTIRLEGQENTLSGISYGIYVYSSGGTASLTITGEKGGSLNASGYANGIYVQSNSGDAALTIQNAEVTATSEDGGGVMVQAGDSSNASLSVEGGSLTATGNSNYGAGIRFRFGRELSGSGTPSLTVSENAVVKASGNAGGIANNSSTEVKVGDGNSHNGGIVFADGKGTVYGAVELQKDLAIGEGESLTIPDDESLTIPQGEMLTNAGTVTNNGALTNNGTINNSGALENNDTLTNNGTIDNSGTLENNNALTNGGTINNSGTIDNSGTVTNSGTLENTNGTINNSGTLPGDITGGTINHKVTGVSLSKTSTTITAGQTETLTATITPENASNKAVEWSTSDEKVATVNSGKVTAVAPGTANITVTTQDGSKTASCTVTVYAATTITTQPADATVVEGETATFAVDATGSGTLTYQWQQSTDDGKNWNDISGETGNNYTTAAVTASMNGTQYRCAVNGDGGQVTSNAVTLTVTAKTYALSADPAALGFGSVQTGYSQPAAVTVTVKNTGNQTLTLTQPTAANFEVGTLSKKDLAPADTATFTVRPKAGLGAGSYSERIAVAGSGSNGGSASVVVTATFKVTQGSGTSAATPTPTPAATPLEQHALHFNTMGGLPLADVIRGLGAPVELWPYTPVRPGYLFMGWYADEALTQPVGTIVLVEDTTIYAKWAADPAAVQSGSGSGGGTGGGSGSGSKATPTPTPSPTPSPTPEPTVTPEPTATPQPEPEEKGGFPVAPVAAGAAIAVLLLAGGGVLWFRRSRR